MIFVVELKSTNRTISPLLLKFADLWGDFIIYKCIFEKFFYKSKLWRQISEFLYLDLDDYLSIRF